MKIKRTSNQVMIHGIKNFSAKGRKIDFYLITPNAERMYAFSRNYSHSVYELCKGGIGLNTLSTLRSRDTGIMNLVKYTNYMMTYLIDYYELPVA